MVRRYFIDMLFCVYRTQLLKTEQYNAIVQIRSLAQTWISGMKVFSLIQAAWHSCNLTYDKQYCWCPHEKLNDALVSIQNICISG